MEDDDVINKEVFVGLFSAFLALAVVLNVALIFLVLWPLNRHVAVWPFHKLLALCPVNQHPVVTVKSPKHVLILAVCLSQLLTAFLHHLPVLHFHQARAGASPPPVSCSAVVSTELSSYLFPTLTRLLVGAALVTELLTSPRLAPSCTGARGVRGTTTPLLMLAASAGYSLLVVVPVFFFLYLDSASQPCSPVLVILRYSSDPASGKAISVVSYVAPAVVVAGSLLTVVIVHFFCSTGPVAAASLKTSSRNQFDKNSRTTVPYFVTQSSSVKDSLSLTRNANGFGGHMVISREVSYSDSADSQNLGKASAFPYDTAAVALCVIFMELLFCARQFTYWDQAKGDSRLFTRKEWVQLWAIDRFLSLVSLSCVPFCWFFDPYIRAVFSPCFACFLSRDTKASSANASGFSHPPSFHAARSKVDVSPEDSVAGGKGRLIFTQNTAYSNSPRNDNGAGLADAEQIYQNIYPQDGVSSILHGKENSPAWNGGEARDRFGFIELNGAFLVRKSQSEAPKCNENGGWDVDIDVVRDAMATDDDYEGGIGGSRMGVVGQRGRQKPPNTLGGRGPQGNSGDLTDWERVALHPPTAPTRPSSSSDAKANSPCTPNSPPGIPTHGQRQMPHAAVQVPVTHAPTERGPTRNGSPATNGNDCPNAESRYAQERSFQELRNRDHSQYQSQDYKKDVQSHSGNRDSGLGRRPRNSSSPERDTHYNYWDNPVEIATKVRDVFNGDNRSPRRAGNWEGSLSGEERKRQPQTAQAANRPGPEHKRNPGFIEHASGSHQSGRGQVFFVPRRGPETVAPRSGGRQQPETSLKNGGSPPFDLQTFTYPANQTLHSLWSSGDKSPQDSKSPRSGASIESRPSENQPIFNLQHQSQISSPQHHQEQFNQASFSTGNHHQPSARNFPPLSQTNQRKPTFSSQGANLPPEHFDESFLFSPKSKQDQNMQQTYLDDNLRGQGQVNRNKFEQRTHNILTGSPENHVMAESSKGWEPRKREELDKGRKTNPGLLMQVDPGDMYSKPTQQDPQGSHRMTRNNAGLVPVQDNGNGQRLHTTSGGKNWNWNGSNWCNKEEGELSSKMIIERTDDKHLPSSSRYTNEVNKYGLIIDQNGEHGLNLRENGDGMQTNRHGQKENTGVPWLNETSRRSRMDQNAYRRMEQPEPDRNRIVLYQHGNGENAPDGTRRTAANRNDSGRINQTGFEERDLAESGKTETNHKEISAAREGRIRQRGPTTYSGASQNRTYRPSSDDHFCQTQSGRQETNSGHKKRILGNFGNSESAHSTSPNRGDKEVYSDEAHTGSQVESAVNYDKRNDFVQLQDDYYEDDAHTLNNFRRRQPSINLEHGASFGYNPESQC